MANILPHTRALDVGANEILLRHSFNRSSKRLLENDAALDGQYEKYLLSLNVFEYVRGHVYGQGDLVWVKRSLGDRRLFLVRCLLDENSSDLQKIVDQAYVEGADEQPDPEFDRHGWKDENRPIDVQDYGIDQKLRRYFERRLSDHERSDAYHRFGELTSDRDVADKKLLLADLSNADRSRDIVFYPYYTRRIEPDDSIVYGFYRVWDAGTLEVDIVYRFGYGGQTLLDGYAADAVKCNDFSMKSVQYANAETNRYFSTAKDRDIFAPQSDGRSDVGDMVQTGRNDYANTYSAKIRFPRFQFGGKAVQFADAGYMVFGSDVLSQDADKALGCVEPSANCVMYCDKTRQGFTALYVTYPDDGHLDEKGYNAANGGLVSNSFHCRVIGRWTEEPGQA